MEKIVEVDPSGVLALLDESGADRHVGESETVLNGEDLPSGDVDRVSRTELQQISSSGIKRRVLNELDGDTLVEPSSKSVMFNVASWSNEREPSVMIYL